MFVGPAVQQGVVAEAPQDGDNRWNRPIATPRLSRALSQAKHPPNRAAQAAKELTAHHGYMFPDGPLLPFDTECISPLLMIKAN